MDEAARQILATGARVVGCTSTFEQHVASLALLRRIHELDPEIITMLGGANCETVMGAATHRCFPWVDYVVSGEADGLITQLCRLALTNGRNVAASDLPPGVIGPCHRYADSGPRKHREVARALFRDLDALPTPQFSHYFQALNSSPLKADIRPGLPVETSRGCWWGAVHQCTFCGLNGTSLGFRSKSPARVLEELNELECSHGIGGFQAADNILDMGYFSQLLPQIAADGHQRSIFFEVKANLSRAQVEMLVRSGITWVQPGIESLHSAVLDLMDKGVTGWQNIQLLKWAGEFGLRLTWSIIWGFPGERDSYYEQMAEWIPALEHLQPPMGVIRLRYDRYSVYHNQAERMGLRLFPIGAMSYVYPLPPSDLSELAYFFTAEPSQGPMAITQSQLTHIKGRPGLRSVMAAADLWTQAFWGQAKPVLAMEDRDDLLCLTDTRGCSGSVQRHLKGLARAVYLACDNAPRPDRLADAVRKHYDPTASDREVRETVEELVAERLVIRIDGRLLGLAVRGAIPALPGRQEYPGGCVRYPGARPAAKEPSTRSAHEAAPSVAGQRP